MCRYQARGNSPLLLQVILRATPRPQHRPDARAPFLDWVNRTALDQLGQKFVEASQSEVPQSKGPAQFCRKPRDG